jgi:hypothetical protein
VSAGRLDPYLRRYREALAGGLSGLAAEAWGHGAVLSSRLLDRALLVSAGARLARGEELQEDPGAVLDWLFG